jgi:hypothetical protein
VLGKLRDVWGRWRESRRQYQLERALYKMNGGYSGSPTFNSGLRAPTDAHEGKAPDARAK